MSDWQKKLAGLQAQLEAKERSAEEEKSATLKAFRKRLEELEPVLAEAHAFGDAFGVDLSYHISRFDERYPYLELTIKRPLIQDRVECRYGVLHENLKEGAGRRQERQVALASLAVKAFEQRLTGWVRAAAEANRKVPGRKA